MDKLELRFVLIIILVISVVSVGVYYIFQSSNLFISDIVHNRQAQENLKYKIAIVEPTFTEAAYNNAFYVFYGKHNLVSKTTKITTDLNYLTASLDDNTTNLAKYDRASIGILHNIINKSFPNANVTIIDDGDVDHGQLFSNNRNNAFDVLILLHEEYVTQKMYNYYKHFVSTGGTIIFFDSNFFYAEVNHDEYNNTITLVKGHEWEFDGNNAKPSVYERWFNETREWIGGNFWTAPVHAPIHFKNNIFNYTHFEETYVNNPNDSIILDYGAYDPSVKVQKIIATYKLSYGKGNVIVMGIYGQYALNSIEFRNFFESIILQVLKTQT